MKGTSALNAERALADSVRALLVQHGHPDPVVIRCERINDGTVEALVHCRAVMGRSAHTAWIHDDGQVLVVPGFVP